MSNSANDIRVIGGHSPLIVATVKKDGEKTNPQSDYGGGLTFTRHGKSITANPGNGTVVKFVYVPSLRRLVAVITKGQSREMTGNYNCHLQLITPEGTEFRPNYAQTNFIQGLEGK